MSILPGFGCPDKVLEVFSPMDRKGICQAGRPFATFDETRRLTSASVCVCVVSSEVFLSDAGLFGVTTRILLARTFAFY